MCVLKKSDSEVLLELLNHRGVTEHDVSKLEVSMVRLVKNRLELQVFTVLRWCASYPSWAIALDV